MFITDSGGETDIYELIGRQRADTFSNQRWKVALPSSSIPTCLPCGKEISKPATVMTTISLFILISLMAEDLNKRW